MVTKRTKEKIADILANLDDRLSDVGEKEALEEYGISRNDDGSTRIISLSRLAKYIIEELESGVY